jgi:hypothetical protein
LAWDLGSMLASEDLEHVARLQRQIQHYDSVESRSTVMTCEQLSRDVSRTADAWLLGREILGTDLTLRDYVTWLGQRQRIARPGTPLWVTIETELSSARAQQVTALCGIADPLPLNASHEQLTALTAAAMSVKSRNFVFSSESSLMEKTPAAEQRARNLELINLRLQLLSPWLATGKVSGVAQSSEPGLSAMVFQAERSHLLMPVAWSRNFQSQQSLGVVCRAWCGGIDRGLFANTRRGQTPAARADHGGTQSIRRIAAGRWSDHADERSTSVHTGFALSTANLWSGGSFASRRGSSSTSAAGTTHRQQPGANGEH